MRAALAAITALIALLMADPIAATEFCTSPTEAAREYACHAALLLDTGGFLVVERQPSPGEPLRIVGQWIDATFAAAGPEVTIAASATGPMWRPLTALTGPSEAVVVWADGSNRRISLGEYAGFSVRGALVERGQEVPTRTWTIFESEGGRSGFIEPALAYDPIQDRLAVAAWHTAEQSTRLATFPIAMARGGDWLPERVTHRGMNLVSLQAHPLHGFTMSGPYGAEVVRWIVGAGEDDRLELGVGPLLAAIAPGGAVDYPNAAVGPDGQDAVVATAMSWNAPLGLWVSTGYLALARNDEGITHAGVWTGSMPADVNHSRGAVAYVGDNPTLFLPVVSREGGSLELLVLPLPRGSEPAVLDRESAAVYPLPGGLNQFSVIFASYGLEGRAALAATSGDEQTRFCIWPSELIGFGPQEP